MSNRQNSDSVILIGSDHALEIQRILVRIDSLQPKLLSLGVKSTVTESEVTTTFKDLSKMINAWLE